MHRVMVVLGIRPDFIRTSKVLKLLKEHPKIDATFVHTGQHYDEFLNDIFFKQLEVPPPDIQLDTRAPTHCGQHAKLISGLEPIIDKVKPDVCLFLGDANAVIGCIAPLKMGVPIAHIEAGMRSYNWDMPEERNRVIIDRVSDVLYVYHNNYMANLIREGINPSKIVVVGNIIVDVIQEYMDELEWPKWEEECDDMGCCHMIPSHIKIGNGSVVKDNYALMTLHRDEHVRNKRLSQQIIDQVACATHIKGLPVVFIEMPRIKALSLQYPSNFIVSKPLGFFEFGRLEANAAIEYTDSGTNQEAAAIYGTPCVVTRSCTERPETFDCGISVMTEIDIVNATDTVLSAKYNSEFSLGDGLSSHHIVDDLVDRLDTGTFNFARRNPHIDLSIRSHMKDKRAY